MFGLGKWGRYLNSSTGPSEKGGDVREPAELCACVSHCILLLTCSHVDVVI
jgi:hypothetical protein